MKLQYAATQVCEITLSRSEVQSIIAENLIARGYDPSYDFARAHPIFVWDEKYKELSVRFVQQAVVAKEREQWRQLKPIPTSTEINRIMEQRIAANNKEI